MRMPPGSLPVRSHRPAPHTTLHLDCPHACLLDKLLAVCRAPVPQWTGCSPSLSLCPACKIGRGAAQIRTPDPNPARLGSVPPHAFPFLFLGNPSCLTPSVVQVWLTQPPASRTRDQAWPVNIFISPSPPLTQAGQIRRRPRIFDGRLAGVAGPSGHPKGTAGLRSSHTGAPPSPSEDCCEEPAGATLLAR